MIALNGGRYSTPKFVYLPNGTYNISNTIFSKYTSNNSAWSNGWASGMILMGQSETGTILKLNNNAAGFNSTSAPKAVIMTGSENPTSSAGGGNQAFRHSVMNLTVDTGTGNSGAIGVDYQVSNRGGIEHVTIKSGDGAGVNGIRMTRGQQGPGLIKDVTINGFNIGIEASQWDFSMTLEDVTLINQNTRGIKTTSQSLHVRDLTSQNSVTAIETSGGLLTLLDSNFTGGASGQIGVDINSGAAFIRNLKSAGYNKVIDSEAGTLTDVNGGAGTTAVGEYVTHGVQSLFASPTLSLGLGIEETPEFYQSDLSKWANVNSYTVGSTTAGIQEAIDSGKEVVYLPSGVYRISSDVIIRGNVKKIIGMQSSIGMASGVTGKKIRFESAADKTVVMEHLWLDVEVQHNGPGTLSIRHSDLNILTSSTAASTGKLFLEDVISSHNTFAGSTKIWARQYNTESENGANVTLGANNDLWVFGMKHERDQVLIQNNGGDVEVLGVFIYDYGTFPAGLTLFVNDGGRMSITKSGHYEYPNYMQTRRDGVWQTRTTADLDGSGYNVPLFNSYKIEPRVENDAFVRAGTFANQNFGNDAELLVKNVSDSSFDRRSYLRLNVAGANATDTFKVRLFGRTDGGTINVRMHESSDITWSESGVTWNNRPSMNTLPISTQNISGTTNQWYEFDVTNAVRSAITAGRSHVTIAFDRDTTSSVTAIFNSLQASSNRPQLVSTSGVTTLVAADDAYVRNGTYAGTNYGSDGLLTVKNSSSSFNRVSLLKFNLSSVGSAVSSALLKLPVITAGTNASAMTIEVRLIASDTWSESSVTWNNQPATSTLLTTLPGSSLIAGATASVNLTSVVNAERAGDGTLSLALVAVSADGSERWVNFGSSEQANPLNRVRLEWA